MKTPSGVVSEFPMNLKLQQEDEAEKNKKLKRKGILITLNRIENINKSHDWQTMKISVALIGKNFELLYDNYLKECAFETRKLYVQPGDFKIENIDEEMRFFIDFEFEKH